MRLLCTGSHIGVQSWGNSFGANHTLERAPIAENILRNLMAVKLFGDHGLLAKCSIIENRGSWSWNSSHGLAAESAGHNLIGLADRNPTGQPLYNFDVRAEKN